MKKILFYSFSLLLGANLLAQNVGIGTNTPDASAKLDVVDANRGVLIPRVALTATNASGPVTSPATSLLVYNTATSGTAPNNVWPGFYYWNGSSWVRLDTGNGDWKLLGNAGTNETVNFIGTTDAQGLTVRTNNLERFRFSGSAYQLLSMGNGTAGAPAYSFNSENNSGMYRSGAGSLSLSTGGIERLRVTNTPQILSVGSGTAASPAWSFTATTNTGIFSPGTGSLGFSTNGTERARILDNGFIGIGTTAPSGYIHFVAPTDINNWLTLWDNNFTGSGLARFQNTNASNGSRVLMGATNYSGSAYAASGVTGLSLNTTTTGSGGQGVYAGANNKSGIALYANLYYTGTYSGWAGYFNADVYCGGTYFGSDQRLKTNIKPISSAIDIVNQLNPVSYNYDTKKYPHAGFEEKLRFGFIAQELEKVLPNVVKEKTIILNSNIPNTIESVSQPKEEALFKVVDYVSLIPILTQAIKEQQNQIEELQVEINRQKEEIKRLKEGR